MYLVIFIYLSTHYVFVYLSAIYVSIYMHVTAPTGRSVGGYNKMQCQCSKYVNQRISYYLTAGENGIQTVLAHER